MSLEIFNVYSKNDQQFVNALTYFFHSLAT